MKKMRWRYLNFMLWQRWFQRHPRLKRFLQWAKTKSLPGFFGVPIYDVAWFFYRELQKQDLFVRANAIAFSFFLSLFPTIIALFTLIPVFKVLFLDYLPGGNNFDVLLQSEIKKIMPGMAGDRLFFFVEDITSNPRIGLLSLGFLFAIYFGSNGMLSLMRSFDKTYPEAFKKRGSWMKRWIAIWLTVMLTSFVVVSIVLIILGQSIIQSLSDWLNLSSVTWFFLGLLRWVVIISLYYVSITMTYRHGAALIRKFRFFTPGAALASLLSLLSSVGFSFYVDSFNNYNRFYGSIGAIVVLMLWIQMNSMWLLIGYELNASIAVNRSMRIRILEKGGHLPVEHDDEAH
jgi:membrane protein